MRKYIIILLAAVLMTACSTDDISPVKPPHNLRGDSTLLDINASIMQESGTRAINTGTKFKYHDKIGIWCTVAGNMAPYNQRKNNIQAEWRQYWGNERQKFLGLTSDYWRYSYEGSNATFVSLFIAPNTYIDDNGGVVTRNMDVYAYAPYSSGVSDLTAIPFSIATNTPDSSQVDYMYAVENLSSEASNKNIDVSDGGDKNITFSFAHAMTGIKVIITNKNTDNDNTSKSQLDVITIKKSANGTTPLYTSGTLNALTGEMKGSKESDSINLTNIEKWMSPDNDNKAEATILLVPTDYKADGDYLLSLVIDGQRMTTRHNETGEETAYEYALPRELFKYTDSGGTVHYGLRAGYTYTLEFTYDNYIHISNIYVDDTWKDDKNTIHRDY